MSDIKQRHLGGLNIAVLLAPAAQADASLDSATEALEGHGAMIKRIGARQGDGVDLSFQQAKADDFDGALVPGGDAALQALKSVPDAARILRGLEREDKPVGALETGTDVQDFLAALARRTRDSVRGTADSLPGAAATGG